MSARRRAVDAPPMFRRLRDLKGMTIAAADCDVGSVSDAYFDDASWTVRYIVVDTGTWLPGRQVLLSPAAVDEIDVDGRRLVTRLTKVQVESAPEEDTAMPISRQKEVQLAMHYQYPYYWAGPLRWGAAPYVYGADLPAVAGAPATPGMPSAVEAEEQAARLAPEDAHLRSANEVKGYGIQATDGELGEVEDFLFDDATWAIRYLEVDPARWWPSAHVLVSVEWVREIDWSESKVVVDVTRDAVRNAPSYDPSVSIDREWERGLHRYYGRPGYWERADDAWRLWPPGA
jgi:sporulation protein YlmC with PRC-barrel domain